MNVVVSEYYDFRDNMEMRKNMNTSGKLFFLAERTNDSSGDFGMIF
jgi:hypothetical protein